MVKHRVPNIVRGGVALPLDKTDYYLVRGRKHEQGGIDIGKNPRTGLEVEDGEIVHVGDKELRVFSAEPILGGVSPSQLVMRGVNPDKVFAAQERFKQVNGIKDDGTKAPFGTLKKLIFGVDFKDIKTSDGRGYNPAYIERAYSSLKKSGLTKKQQAVVLANIIEESGGDPFALNKNSGKDYGTLQWVDRYPKSNETDPYKEIDNQMGYFLNTINNLDDQVSWTHGGKGSGYQSRKDAYNDFNSEDIETINKGFVLGHVRPAGKHASAKNRIGVAEQIYDRIKRLGGNMKHNLVEVNIGGSSKLIRVAKHPSTGESERSEGLTRKRAVLGTEKEDTITKGSAFKEGLFNESLLTKTLYPLIPEININKPAVKLTGKQKLIKTVGSGLKSGIIGDAIGIGTNIIGGITSNIINRKMLNSLEFPKAPIPYQATKLKTKININSQLDAMRENLADYERSIAGNTASSRVALARTNNIRNKVIRDINQTYGQKENIETQLINTDRQNQQTINNKNIEAINTYNTNKVNFENKIRELKAENNVDLIQNISQGVQDLLARRESRGLFNRNLMAQTFANPNLPAELYYASGIWPEEVYNMYRKQYPR